MKMPKTKPLGGVRYFQCGPYPIEVGICSDRKAWAREMKRRNCRSGMDHWPPGNAGGHLVTFDKSDKDCMVMFIVIDWDRVAKISIPEVVGVAAHEATHAWQKTRRQIGERKPGEEQEAYFIGWLTQCVTHYLLFRK